MAKDLQSAMEFVINKLKSEQVVLCVFEVPRGTGIDPGIASVSG